MPTPHPSRQSDSFHGHGLHDRPRKSFATIPARMTPAASSVRGCSPPRGVLLPRMSTQCGARGALQVRDGSQSRLRHWRSKAHTFISISLVRSAKIAPVPFGSSTPMDPIIVPVTATNSTNFETSLPFAFRPVVTSIVNTLDVPSISRHSDSFPHRYITHNCPVSIPSCRTYAYQIPEECTCTRDPEIQEFNIGAMASTHHWTGRLLYPQVATLRASRTSCTTSLNSSGAMTY